MKMSKYASMLLIIIFIFSCLKITGPSKPFPEMSRLAKITERGELRVVTDFNSSSYFIYRGQPMGFQFEMLQELSDYLGVKLNVRVNNNLEEKFGMLEDGEVDLIAVNLTVTEERSKRIDFTVPFSTTREVLVQRKYTEDASSANNKGKNKPVKGKLDLAGKVVYVQRHSSYVDRLKSLANQIGDTIVIKEVDYGVEELIEMVAKKQIDYTIADDNIAKLNSKYFDNIYSELSLSDPQDLAWAVPMGSDDLKYAIDGWLETFTKSKSYSRIYNRYFRNNSATKIVESELFSNISGKISPYDNYIKEYSKTIGWDWRLVASLIYQESRFNPKAISWAGAYGLMQFMPGTGKQFGVTRSSDVKKQIKAGIDYIRWLDERFKNIKDDEERMKFVLASYNVGLGHVRDARALAEKYGKDPDVWDNNVDIYILWKSRPEYYNDPVVKYGYCRGSETYSYVTGIVERYEHYKNLIQE